VVNEKCQDNNNFSNFKPIICKVVKSVKNLLFHHCTELIGHLNILNPQIVILIVNKNDFIAFNVHVGCDREKHVAKNKNLKVPNFIYLFFSVD
jgi:hypothetical protein